MRRECPATCGLCTAAGYYGLGSYAGAYTGSYAGAYSGYGYEHYGYPSAYLYNYQCTDAIEDCAQYVNAGWCGYEGQTGTGGFVTSNCQRSCGLCVYKK